MKISLSRKGFDSSYGGCPSPILPDGTILSMPIPSYREEVNKSITSQTTFKNIAFNGKSYEQIWKEISPKTFKENLVCHLDPDIRPNIKILDNDKWLPIFGQVSSAQTHLQNNQFSVGDLFLFFGLFCQTEEIDGKLKFTDNSSWVHMLYGYMQVGEIVTGDDIKKYNWHPHSQDGYSNNNTIYIASNELILDGVKTGLKGYGTFNYDDKYVLTADGMSKSKWEVPEWFKNADITYHSEKNFKDDYFQSVSRGQEFIIKENENNAKWIKELLNI